MGVELGKVLAKNILAQLETPADVKGHDSSVRYFIFIRFRSLIIPTTIQTTGLIHYYQKHRKE